MGNTNYINYTIFQQQRNFSKILDFLNHYSGQKYDINNIEISTHGKLAYEYAKKLGEVLEGNLSDFEFIGATKWQISGTVRDYFWLQFKKIEHRNSPFSISVSTVNIGGKHHFKVHLESEDRVCEIAKNKDELSQMFCRSIIDVDQPNCDFYYLGVTKNPHQYIRLGNKFETATLNLYKYYKITTNIDIVVDEDETDTSILDRITIAFKELIPAYDAIFGEGPKNESWIIPCNCEKYDVIKAFTKYKELDWHLTQQTKNIGKGDIVYIYVGKPFSRLMYKCEVVKTDLDKREIDDSEFVKVPQELWEGKGFRIRLLDKLDGLNLSLEDLNDHGVKGRIQGARKLENQALNHIEKNSKPSKIAKLINSEEIEQLLSLSEDELESALNKDDDSSCYVFKEAIVKVRKINKEIIDKLKSHYAGECQLCGSKVGAEFGKEIVEAHHIEYFSKTQNNDASNIIILCPNCHRLIHSCNPIYHKKEVYFEFDDGKKISIKNPGHLKI